MPHYHRAARPARPAPATQKRKGPCCKKCAGKNKPKPKPKHK
jgi:hypothetical protein